MAEIKYLSGKHKVLVAIGILMLVVVLAVYVHGIHRVDPRKLDQLIERSLAPGSDQAQVIAFLDSNHIAHTEYMAENHRIQGQIGKSTIGLMRGRILIDFYFDVNGKLAGHKTWELFDFL